MKKFNLILTTLLLCLSLCACSGQGFDKSRLLKSEYMGARMCPDISLRLRQEDINKGSSFIDLRLKNSGSTDYSFDAGRRLEVQLGGVWYIVPDSSPAITMALYQLPAGETADIKLQLEGHYTNLPAGHYRVVKCFSDPRGRQQPASAEFDIN